MCPVHRFAIVFPYFLLPSGSSYEILLVVHPNDHSSGILIPYRNPVGLLISFAIVSCSFVERNKNTEEVSGAEWPEFETSVGCSGIAYFAQSQLGY